MTAALGSSGPAGTLTISTPHLTITGGSQVASQTGGSGPGGVINVQGTSGPAQSVLIDGAGTGLFTNTQGTGAGGDIHLLANAVTLQNGGTLSAATSGTASSAIGGTITVDATDTVTMTNGGSITAGSTGPSNAGNISINAGRQLIMQNSSIKTEAAQAGGGNINIRAVDLVRLGNSSVSTSVLGGTGSGGNITIDPNIVLLQNSRILAQAVQGAGGNISITTNLLLSDANSVISASSEFGQNGTVTIQSPIAPASGKIVPLSQKPLIATGLLSQRCAALAGGSFSSFTVAGRDSLPAEPGSWLSSPLAALSAGLGQEVRGEGGSRLSSLSSLSGLSSSVRAGFPSHQIDRIDQIDQTDETPVLSLRQIAPPGFLTQTFAIESSAGCTS
jgi:large exoprotein involved in heme utilization and adhesion